MTTRLPRLLTLILIVPIGELSAFGPWSAFLVDSLRVCVSRLRFLVFVFGLERNFIPRVVVIQI